MENQENGTCEYENIPNTDCGGFVDNGFLAQKGLYATGEFSIGKCDLEQVSNSEPESAANRPAGFESKVYITEIAADVGDPNTPSPTTLLTETAIVNYVKNVVDEALKDSGKGGNAGTAATILMQSAPYVVTNLPLIKMREYPCGTGKIRACRVGFYTYFPTIADCLAYLNENGYTEPAEIFVAWQPTETKTYDKAGPEMGVYRETVTVELSCDLTLNFADDLVWCAAEGPTPEAVLTVNGTGKEGYRMTVEACAIDGEEKCRGVKVSKGRLVMRAELVNGAAADGDGGGLLLEQSEAQLHGNLVNCVSTSGNGGGVAVIEGELKLQGIRIDNCAAEKGEGGGLYGKQSDLTAGAGTEISECHATRGGGAATYGGTQTFTGLVFGGIATSEGGGWFLAGGSDLTFTGAIEGCHALFGGGFYATGNQTRASLVTSGEQPLLRKNEATEDGSGGGFCVFDKAQVILEGEVESCGTPGVFIPGGDNYRTAGQVFYADSANALSDITAKGAQPQEFTKADVSKVVFEKEPLVLFLVHAGKDEYVEVVIPKGINSDRYLNHGSGGTVNITHPPETKESDQ